MDDAYIDSTIEALILASPEPLPARKISQVVAEATPSRVAAAVASLNDRYAGSACAMRIREIAGGYQHYIMPEYVGYVEELFSRQRKLRLTRAALETVAIIAYRQPVTKSEVEHIRGVASDGVIQNLLGKGMITITGRAKTVGKPLQYGVTDEFLKFFGLNSLDDLPRMSEIEELIAAQDSQDQTELALETGSLLPGAAMKLNVADGTFDPAERRELDDEDEQPENERDEVTPKLVLKAGGEDTSGADEETDTDAETENDETVESVQPAGKAG